MARGRKPKGAEVIELQGPARHKAAPAPPEARAGALDPPDWFNADALFAWTFWTTQLADMGILYTVDSLALQGACAAYSRALKWERKLTQEPDEWRADIAATRAWKQVKDFSEQFGLTLVSRNRVNLPSGGSQMELELEAVIGG